MRYIKKYKHNKSHNNGFLHRIKTFFSNIYRKVFTSKSSILKRGCVGVVDHCNQDYAYIILNSKMKDVFIESKNLLSAIDGDIVLINIFTKKTENNKYTGQVIKIIKRKYTFFVGTLKRDTTNNFFLDIKNKHIYSKIIIDKKNALENIKNTIENIKQNNLRVKCQIINYPNYNKGIYTILCRIVEIFGAVGEHESEMKTIINNYSLPTSFSEKALQEANKLIIPDEKILSTRRDFRDVLTVTIDPENAKDFDDAISFKKINDEQYEIGIHIADVSYFVKENTYLDREAYKRNTSVYLIDRVIPMLPEILCNDLCSLVQNADRLTMSIVFNIDNNGNILKEWIGETIINSNYRLTYDEAQNILNNTKDNMHDTIYTLFKISQKLRQKRIKNGSVNFNFEDYAFSVDDEKNLVIKKIECQESHNMIEEYMLLANEHIATYISTLSQKIKNGKHLAFVYRIHDEPTFEKINDFCTLMKNLKIKMDNNRKNFATNLNSLLDTIKDAEECKTIATLAMRTMQKAIYSTKPLGHYGLAFKHYTHFTSPIRRYADIIVHRLLKQYLKGEYGFNKNKYEEICKYANEREIVASDAERDSIKFKQVAFLQEHKGEKYEGVITGMTDIGMYVEIKKIKCDGFLRFSEYKHGNFLFNKTYFKAVEQYTGTTYCIGNNIDIIIKNCNIEKGLVDFTFV